MCPKLGHCQGWRDPSWALQGTEQHPWPHPRHDNHRCPQTSPSVSWVENHSWDGSHPTKGLSLLKLSSSHPRLTQKPPPSPWDKNTDAAEPASDPRQAGCTGASLWLPTPLRHTHRETSGHLRLRDVTSKAFLCTSLSWALLWPKQRFKFLRVPSRNHLESSSECPTQPASRPQTQGPQKHRATAMPMATRLAGAGQRAQRPGVSKCRVSRAGLAACPHFPAAPLKHRPAGGQPLPSPRLPTFSPPRTSFIRTHEGLGPPWPPRGLSLSYAHRGGPRPPRPPLPWW